LGDKPGYMVAFLRLFYRSLRKPFVDEVKSMREYRKMMNLLNNKNLDMVISVIGVPVLKHMLYNNPLYKAKHGVLAPKLMTYLKKGNILLNTILRINNFT
jgi:digeranylgeranylglycerophospholipid reductase